MITKTLNLKHDFSNDEINDIAKEMSAHLNTKVALEIEKSQAMKGYSSQIKYWDKKINQLNELITNEFEYRDISCEVKYNDPVVGQKTIIRQDNYEQWQEPMSIDEIRRYIKSC